MNDLVNLDKTHVETIRGAHWLDSIDGARTALQGRAPAELDEWTLVFAYARNPIPMNGSRGGHHAHARIVRGVRLVTKREAAYAGIPSLGRCQVQLTWYVLDGTRRDPVNLSPTLKAMQDGLVDAGVVADDTPDLMNTVMSSIVRVDRMKHTSAWMELVVCRWAGAGE